ncbi:hypothetical protein A1F97_01197 [Pyrenophora tritici-repentis]|nr:hypothetical protein A1F95_01045 [Pyrenophora tritici-repentis]PZD45767.1 hypothetical protein A1F97_01197 [Pyrenophora tritici-repentis]
MQYFHITLLAKPTANKDALKLYMHVACGKDLGEGSGIKIMDHSAVAISASLESVGFESRISSIVLTLEPGYDPCSAN